MPAQPFTGYTQSAATVAVVVGCAGRGGGTCTGTCDTPSSSESVAAIVVWCHREWRARRVAVANMADNDDAAALTALRAARSALQSAVLVTSEIYPPSRARARAPHSRAVVGGPLNEEARGGLDDGQTLRATCRPCRATMTTWRVRQPCRPWMLAQPGV
jgi:hypothetical protein